MENSNYVLNLVKILVTLREYCLPGLSLLFPCPVLCQLRMMMGL